MVTGRKLSLHERKEGGRRTHHGLVVNLPLCDGDDLKHDGSLRPGLLMLGSRKDESGEITGQESGHSI